MSYVRFKTVQWLPVMLTKTGLPRTRTNNDKDLSTLTVTMGGLFDTMPHNYTHQSLFTVETKDQSVPIAEVNTIKFQANKINK